MMTMKGQLSSVQSLSRVQLFEGTGEGMDRAGCVQAQEPGWRCPGRRQGRVGRFSELSLETGDQWDSGSTVM